MIAPVSLNVNIITGSVCLQVIGCFIIAVSGTAPLLVSGKQLKGCYSFHWIRADYLFGAFSCARLALRSSRHLSAW